MQVETQIALRYLRGKKRSAFLSIITVISIIGVALGSAALIVVLSVMSGFEEDLKSKILGANAHGVILKAGIDFAEYEEIAQKARSVKGILGAAPYVQGEVMISTPLTTSGIMLKGINPKDADEVSNLRKSVTEGDLEWLVMPEKIPVLSAFEIIERGETDEPINPALEEAIQKGLELGLKGEAKKEEAKPGVDVFEEMERGDPKKEKPSNKILPGILIGQELSKSLRVLVGDRVHLISPLGDGAMGPMGPIPKARTFRVAGLFYSGFYEYDAKMAYISLEEAQSFLGMGDTVSGIEIKCDSIDRASSIMAQAREAVGGYPYRTRDWQQMNRNLFSALKLEKLVMFIILIFIVLVASFNIISALYMFVTEKEKEIAIMKSMGACDKTVSSIFKRIGLTIGCVGTVLGIASGYILCLFIEAHGIKLNPDVYYIEKSPVVMDALEFAIVAAASVAISYAATIPPSLIASRMKPVDGLRYD